MMLHLETSDVITLHPSPVLAADSKASNPRVKNTCCSCNACLDSSILVLPSCGHPYCLLCLSYRVSTSNQCVFHCLWPQELRANMGISTQETGSIKKPEPAVTGVKPFLEGRTLLPEFSDVSEPKPTKDDAMSGGTPSTSASPIKAFSHSSGKTKSGKFVETAMARISGISLQEEIPNLDAELASLTQQQVPIKDEDKKAPAAIETIIVKEEDAPPNNKRKTRARKDAPAKSAAKKRQKSVEDTTSLEDSKSGEESDADARSMREKLCSYTPFVPFKDSPPDPPMKVVDIDLEELCAPRSRMTSRLIELYGRYLHHNLPSEWKNKIFFYPSFNFHLFKEATASKKKTEASRNIVDIVKQGMKGLVMSKCQYVLLPVLENEHFVLAIFAFAEGNPAVLRAPSIHILNSLKAFATNEKAIRGLHTQILTQSMSQTSSGVDFIRRNNVKGLEHLEVPQQPDLSNCGLYVMACMHKFVNAVVGNKELKVTAGWFSHDYALGRRACLQEALLKQCEDGEAIDVSIGR